MDGIDGNCTDRFSMLKPSALMLPDCKCGNAFETSANRQSTYPPIWSVMAGGMLLYGTAVVRIFA